MFLAHQFCTHTHYSRSLSRSHSHSILTFNTTHYSQAHTHYSLSRSHSHSILTFNTTHYSQAHTHYSRSRSHSHSILTFSTTHCSQAHTYHSHQQSDTFTLNTHTQHSYSLLPQQTLTFSLTLPTHHSLPLLTLIPHYSPVLVVGRTLQVSLPRLVLVRQEPLQVTLRGVRHPGNRPHEVHRLPDHRLQLAALGARTTRLERLRPGHVQFAAQFIHCFHRSLLQWNFDCSIEGNIAVVGGVFSARIQLQESTRSVLI